MSEKAEKKQAQMPGMGSSTLKAGGGAAGTDKTDTDARVYIGPDIPGAKQYTVFNNGLPESLKKKTERKPERNEQPCP